MSSRLPCLTLEVGRFSTPSRVAECQWLGGRWEGGEEGYFKCGLC